MQHRRDADRFAYLAQTGAGVTHHLRAQVTELARGMGRAACDHNQDVVGNQLADGVDDAFVLGYAGVVAAHHAGQSAYAAGGNGVIQRPEGTSVVATLHIAQILVGEARHHIPGIARNVGLAAIGVVVDRPPHKLFRRIKCFVLIELHVGGAGDLGLGRRGDQLGVIVLRQASQCLHDALHVHHHGLYRAGYDGQFLVQEVACRRDPMAHQDLVRRAADACQVDPIGAHTLGVLDQLRILGCDHNHLR